MPRRGFERGLPRASRQHDWSYADEIDDIAEAVVQARTEDRDRPVLLLGHSLGAQLAAGHELSREPVDGVITVGGALPFHRHYPLGGLPLVVMATVVVPALTTAFGHLPKPAFGGPGARTLMREWARMAVSGQLPFPADRLIETPSLIISLGGDRLAPAAAVDGFARRLFAPEQVTRWEYDDVLPGNSNDHVTWVRGSSQIVDRVTAWWAPADVVTGAP
ncbi:alpha/beta fold hydrolase [Paractinoplanes durhamensis]|uniref:alpha/beta fold hydrolase n=1 Tax=Paractinoplanes durhamensis TaxID=113563 RepID=UPI003625EE9C